MALVDKLDKTILSFADSIGQDQTVQKVMPNLGVAWATFCGALLPVQLKLFAIGRFSVYQVIIEPN